MVNRYNTGVYIMLKNPPPTKNYQKKTCYPQPRQKISEKKWETKSNKIYPWYNYLVKNNIVDGFRGSAICMYFHLKWDAYNLPYVLTTFLARMF